MIESRPNDPVRPRWQMSLATLLLLVTLVAVLAARGKTWQMRRSLQASIANMQAMTRELIIDDPKRIAAVRRIPTLSNELIFDVYIPPPDDAIRSHRLCMALENIVGGITVRDIFPTPDQVYEFEIPGQPQDVASIHHSIEIRHSAANTNDSNSLNTFEVLVDGEVVMTANRPQSWNVSSGWSGVETVRESRSFDASEQVELYRRRNSELTATGSQNVHPGKPANGILVWIEAEPR